MTTIPSSIMRAAAKMLGIGTILAVSGCADEPLAAPFQTSERPCPQWVAFRAGDHSNADSPYLGCVSAANLRAMVEKPEDLERGRQLGPANGEREAKAIETYRQGKVAPLQGSGAMSPQISVPGSGGGAPQ